MSRRKKTVELFKHGEGTILEVTRKFGAHRRMVRQAVAGAVPPVRKQSR